MKKCILLLALFFYDFQLNAQSLTLNAEQARKDIELYKVSMEEGNPSLYRYQSKQQWEKNIDALLQQCKSGIDAIQFYLALAKITGRIGDGHTRMVLPKDYSDFINYESKSLIPLGLKFMNDKIYVLQHYTNNTQIKDGAELTSINGIAARTLINEMHSYVSADNSNKGFLNRRLDLEYRTLLSLKFGLSKSYRLEIKNRNGKIFTTILHGTTMDSVNSIVKKAYPETGLSRAPYSFKVENEKSAALLIIRDFLNGPDKNYMNFLDSVFTVMAGQKIKNLVIDLRENTGGYDEHAIAVLSYLANKDYSYYKKRVINKTQYNFLKYTNSEYYNQVVKNFKTTLLPDSTYHLTVPWDAKYGKKNPKAFTGKIYFLVNYRVFSSGMALAANAYNYSNAVFIGEETGGNYTGDSGATVLLTLPHSKFLVQIPLVRYEYAVTRTNKSIGLIPQYVVKHSIEDIINGRDRQMQFVWKQIRTY